MTHAIAMQIVNCLNQLFNNFTNKFFFDQICGLGLLIVLSLLIDRTVLLLGWAGSAASARVLQNKVLQSLTSDVLHYQVKASFVFIMDAIVHFHNARKVQFFQ